MTELEQALAYARHLTTVPVEDHERTAARRLLIDSIGCALGGAGDEVSARTIKALGPTTDGVGILGATARLRPADALLVHGAAIRCMDFNDVYSRRNNHHPSEFVVPIVLALAELETWSGARAIDATAIGYRVFLAMGEMWEGLLQRGWAPASTLGRATAACLVGLLRGHDDKIIANAMAIATITAPTLGVVFKGALSDTKSLVNGMAARAGWEALDLAAAGITGPMNAFEGTAGYNQMAGGSFIAPSVEDPMLTAADVSLKAFPTVFMTHTAIAAAVAVSEKIAGRTPKRVVVQAPEKVVAMTATEPKWKVTSREEAQFSLPLAAATALVHGACGLAELEPKALQRPEVGAVLKSLTVEADPAWKGYEGGRVTVEVDGGETVTAEVLAAPGHPRNPMTDDQVLAKFHSLASETLGDDRAGRVAQLIAELASASSVGELFATTRSS